MIEIEFTPAAKEIIRNLDTLPAKLLRAMAAALDAQNELTVGQVQARRLNFPKDGPTQESGLRHQTGGLFQSAVSLKAEIIANAISSSLGSNMIYARVHETGIDEIVQVRAHKRRIIANDRYRRTRGGNFVKTQSGIPGNVRAHSMHMRLPARAPFGNTIADRTQNYTDALSAAIIDTCQGLAQ